MWVSRLSSDGNVVSHSAHLYTLAGPSPSSARSTTASQYNIAAREDLVIPRTATKFGARSFAVAAPSQWNRAPQHIRSKQSVVALKSHLFTIDSS